MPDPRITQTRGADRRIRPDVQEERFSGLALPLVKGSLPDFGPVFERYASDLKLEAERAAP